MEAARVALRISKKSSQPKKKKKKKKTRKTIVIMQFVTMVTKQEKECLSILLLTLKPRNARTTYETIMMH
jgi:hypothetical protein